LNQIKIQPAAALDAEEAANWYEAQQLGLGIQFLLELDAAIDRAAETAEGYEELYLGARRVLMRRFPYSVYFLYESMTIEVFAVLHQHQSPSTWQSRI
jgi:plasmid stabilization system protein ParE